MFVGESPELEAALDEASGHIHWRSDPQQLPLAQREPIYRAIVRFWGDTNDSYEVSRRAVLYQHQVAENGECKLSVRQLEDAWDGAADSFLNYSIGALTRETYDRVKPSAGGIVISNRDADLDVSVDPNVPPVFKRLTFGLRGIGQETLAEGSPLTIMDLEGRNRPTQKENLESLPHKVKGKPEVDLSKLLRHDSKGSRGLISDRETLKANASKIFIVGDLVAELDRSISAGGGIRGWPEDQVRAIFLMPLNEWLAHSLVQYNLQRLAYFKRKRAVKRYEKAIKRYVGRINSALRARREPAYAYQPDTVDRLKPFPDAFNRLYSRPTFPEVSNWGESNSNPDVWFQRVILAEGYRFLVEADLPTLMQMPE